LGLSEQQMTWALGSAGTMASGLWEFNADGAMSKHLHAGRAASSGVLAADLARQDFTGARHILEGERGFFTATSQDAEPGRVVKGLKHGMETYQISGVSIKPYASCRHTHPAIDAVLALRQQPGFALDQIVKVEVETYQAALDLTDKPQPNTPYAAKFSLSYCVARALWWGSAGLSDFTPEAIVDKNVRHLMAKVSLVHSPELEARYPKEWPVRVTVILADGHTLTKTVYAPKGDPETPLSWDELEDKFQKMVAGTDYQGQAEALIEQVRRLDEVEQVKWWG
jgi:2-methylcitrate dehydratase PrpD